MESAVWAAAWQPIGPFGGAAQAVVIDPAEPTHLLAATRNGIFYRSVDGGRHWTHQPFAGELGLSLHSLTRDPQHSAILYATAASDNPALAGLYRSTDDGQRWDNVKELRGISTYSLAIWETDSKVVAVGAQDGVYLSEDGGVQWKRISPTKLADLQPIMSLAFDPKQKEVLYAGTPHLPWKTVDGGKTWNSVHQGMIDDSDVFSIHVDASQPDRVFASACSGIYCTKNAAAQWAKLIGIPRSSRRTYLITQDATNSSIVYACTSTGLWKSSDAGTTWKMVSELVVKSIAFHPADSKHLYLATEDSGMQESLDGGLTSKSINEGFTDRRLPHGFATNKTIYTSAIYELRHGGIYRNGNSGSGWERLPTSAAMAGENILALTSGPKGSLFAISYQSLLRSPDEGKTWVKIKSPFLDTRLTGVGWSGSSLFVASAKGLVRTENLGVLWKPVAIGTAPARTAVESLWQSPQAATMVARTSVGDFLTRDSGKTWTKFEAPDGQRLRSIAVSPDGSLLVGATSLGVLRSTDGGSQWKPARAGLPASTVSAVALHPSRAGEVFAVEYGRVYRSVDAGDTWAELDAGGLDHATVNELVLAESLPNQLFALTLGRGFYTCTLPEAAGSPANGTAGQTGGAGVSKQ